jgi:hypothetical protein
MHCIDGHSRTALLSAGPTSCPTNNDVVIRLKSLKSRISTLLIKGQEVFHSLLAANIETLKLIASINDVHRHVSEIAARGLLLIASLRRG